jgi:hypothetical protein
LGSNFVVGRSLDRFFFLGLAFVVLLALSFAKGKGARLRSIHATLLLNSLFLFILPCNAAFHASHQTQHCCYPDRSVGSFAVAQWRERRKISSTPLSIFWDRLLRVRLQAVRSAGFHASSLLFVMAGLQTGSFSWVSLFSVVVFAGFASSLKHPVFIRVHKSLLRAGFSVWLS